MRQIKIKGSPPPDGYDVTPVVKSLQRYGDVILFGSFYRGEPANDLDFLLITEEEDIEIGDFGVRIDVKICTPGKLRKCLTLKDHVIKTAYLEGLNY